MRIFCCVPSLSEFIFFLRPEALAGRTRFCIYPEEIRKVPAYGGTKTLDLQKITLLHSDLIVAVKEENTKEQIEHLAKSTDVKVFDIVSWADALKANAEIARLLDSEKKYAAWLADFENRKNQIHFPEKPTVAYLIWQNPWMTVGGDTYIHHSLEQAGFVNVFASRNRYPEISLKDLQEKDPDVILLSSEPYPFKEKDIDKFKSWFPGKKVLSADGTYFSWYGSRMSPALDYFSELRSQLI
jgi:ABC-type Fe3+-hydroxamate transport system substrate-binding protein